MVLKTPEITIILIRADWCSYCKHFEPIFAIAEKIYKSNDYLNKYKINFENYDFADKDKKNIFIMNHFNVMNKINGFPTVLLKNNNEYKLVNHTTINDKLNIKEEEKIAANKFLDNIINILKSNESENKILYTQGKEIQEGGEQLQEELYKKKYLKYKSKYLELKK
jgi:thiol-disulfide isomerase/thioredoxin